MVDTGPHYLVGKFPGYRLTFTTIYKEKRDYLVNTVETVRLDVVDHVPDFFQSFRSGATVPVAANLYTDSFPISSLHKG